MTKRRQKSKPLKPVYRLCNPCGQRFLAGYDGDPPMSQSCPACAAGLFRVVEQSETVLVPLPPKPH
jgi:hypothetical protein